MKICNKCGKETEKLHRWCGKKVDNGTEFNDKYEEFICKECLEIELEKFGTWREYIKKLFSGEFDE